MARNWRAPMLCLMVEPPTCRTCNEPVDPAASDVIYAVPLQRRNAMGAVHWTEGIGAYFHEEHFPLGSTGWRLKPKP